MDLSVHSNESKGPSTHVKNIVKFKIKRNSHMLHSWVCSGFSCSNVGICSIQQQPLDGPGMGVNQQRSINQDVSTPS